MIIQQTFEGTVSLFGRAIRVTFSGGMLTFSDLNFAEARRSAELLEHELSAFNALTQGSASQIEAIHQQAGDALKGAVDLVMAGPPGASPSAPPPPPPAAPMHQPVEAPRSKPNGVTAPAKPSGSLADIAPRLDPGVVDTVAANSAKPPPKEKAPPKPKKGAAAAASVEDAEDKYHAEAEAADPAKKVEVVEEDVFTENAKADDAAKAKPAGRRAKEKPEEDTAESDEPLAPKDDAELPEALKYAKKMKDVLAYYLDNGVTETSELQDAVVKLQDKLEFLKVIPDIPGRVLRTLEVMDLGQDRVE